jgi:hypothetical protein
MTRNAAVPLDRIARAVAPKERMNSPAEFHRRRTVESALTAFEDAVTVGIGGVRGGDMERIGTAVYDVCLALTDEGRFKGRLVSFDDKLRESLDELVSRRAAHLQHATKEALKRLRQDVVDAARKAACAYGQAAAPRPVSWP